MIKDKTIKEILNEIEKTAQIYEFSREISHLFSSGIKRAKEIGEKEIERDLIWEERLFAFTVKTEFGDDARKGRFHPFLSGTNEDGTPFNFPDIKDFDEKAIDYFKRRTSETQNPVLKSRYSDFVWELTKDPIYGKNASECYLELADYYYEKTWFVKLHDAFNRVIYFMNIKVVDQKVREIIKRKLFFFLEKMITDDQHRFCLELLESFTFFNKDEILIKDTSSAIKICEACINYFKSSSHHLERRFLLVLEKIYRINKDYEAAKKSKINRAESLIGEAREKEQDKNFLISSRLYEESLEIFRQLGEKDKINFIKDKLREINKKTVKGFKKIKVSKTITREQIKKYTDIILNSESIEESLKRLAYFNDLVPDYSKLVKQTEKMKENNPMQFLASQRTFDENGHIVGSDDDPFQNILIRNSIVYIQISSILIDEIFVRLKKEKNFKQEDLFLFLKNWGLISDNNLKIIEKGVNKYFIEDYISSIHILVPQLEEVIRNMLRRGGIQTTSLKNEKTIITQEKSLNDLLLNEEVKKIFGESLDWYMRIILTERMGLNLRNEVAHGLIKYEQCSFNNLNKIIHIFILLTRFNLITKRL